MAFIFKYSIKQYFQEEPDISSLQKICKWPKTFTIWQQWWVTCALIVSISAFKILLSEPDVPHLFSISERRFDNVECSTLSWPTYIKPYHFKKNHKNKGYRWWVSLVLTRNKKQYLCLKFTHLCLFSSSWASSWFSIWQHPKSNNQHIN